MAQSTSSVYRVKINVGKLGGWSKRGNDLPPLLNSGHISKFPGHDPYWEKVTGAISEKDNCRKNVKITELDRKLEAETGVSAKYQNCEF